MKRIDVMRLEKKKQRADGAIIARCPACAQEGHDTKGEHLIVYGNGAFACICYPKDKAHNAAILRLAGMTSNLKPERRVTMRPYKVSPVKRLCDIRRWSLDKLSGRDGQCIDKVGVASLA